MQYLLSTLVGTQDLNPWEQGFMENVARTSKNGDATGRLTGPQVEKVELLYKKHFAG